MSRKFQYHNKTIVAGITISFVSAFVFLHFFSESYCLPLPDYCQLQMFKGFNCTIQQAVKLCTEAIKSTNSRCIQSVSDTFTDNSVCDVGQAACVVASEQCRETVGYIGAAMLAGMVMAAVCIVCFCWHEQPYVPIDNDESSDEELGIMQTADLRPDLIKKLPPDYATRLIGALPAILEGEQESKDRPCSRALTLLQQGC